MATEVLTDPLDGKDKFVLSNFAMGGTGSIILIDAATGEGETFELPVGAGAWGLVNWRNEKLVVGTCVQQAYLHVFDLKARSWAKPLQSPGEEYFWKMALGSDGKVYGGTYPGCALMQYDPLTHSLIRLGRVSDNEKNLYSRPVWGEAEGRIFVQYGFETNGNKVYDIASGEFASFASPGEEIKEVCNEFVCTQQEGRLRFYDPQTLRPLDPSGLEQRLEFTAIELANGQKISVKRLPSGKLAGVRGQDYFIIEAPSSAANWQQPLEVELKRIPSEAPPTSIHTLQTDTTGNVWGASGFGQTIFRFTPQNGQFWNSPAVCNRGGEVYGIVSTEDRLFFSSYVGGDHIVYDPSAPWDQLNNVNPQTLRSVAPQLIRPEGRSVLGPDGAVWTGWSAKYGTYGGGLSRVDPQTLEVTSWYDPIPEQQVAGIAADDEYIYFTTNGGASGLAYRDVDCHLGVWKPGTGVIHQETFEPAERTGKAIIALGGEVLFGVGKTLRIFDKQKLELTETIPLPAPCSWLVAVGDRKAAVFSGNRLGEIDMDSRVITWAAELPGQVHAAAAADSGELYFAVGSTLFVTDNYK
ncbi:NHL repeat-containing protein [Paenibacillus senegalensis]|uniref:hypothetical protein n=1 Tax=Paenibacillus senegalensis TaxID=1465766 RepID=UPI000474DF4E|nr:hypothetical protein [Paenibacillus senegalensis]